MGSIHRRPDGLIRAVAGLASNRSSCGAAVREAPLIVRSRWRHHGSRCRCCERIASAGSTFRICLPVAELLIIDELGFVPLSTIGAELLCGFSTGDRGSNSPVSATGVSHE